MSEESIKNPPGLDNIFVKSLIDNCLLLLAKFAGNCLKLSSISLHQNIIDLYISYTLDTWSRDLNTDFRLGNCLFGDAK